MIIRKIYKGLLTKIFIISGIVFTLLNIFIVYLHAPGPLEARKEIIFPKGTSQAEIVQILAENDIIRFKSIFHGILKLYGSKYTFKSGEYEFYARISPKQVIRILIDGKSVIHRLLIPEGYTVKEITDLLESNTRLFGEIEPGIPEGFLYPNTYYYSYGDNRQQLINHMKEKMTAVLDKYTPMLNPNSPIKSRRELLILASIVEKEAMIAKEKPIIAGVYINRLKKNMKLQADPTSIYAITMGQYRLDRPLVRSDLKLNSPYNTYMVYGLPPGPISCPGEGAVAAVAQPLETNYIFFVADGRGGHNFSSNLPDHNSNVQKYKNFLSNK